MHTFILSEFTQILNSLWNSLLNIKQSRFMELLVMMGNICLVGIIIHVKYKFLNYEKGRIFKLILNIKIITYDKFNS